MKAFFHRIAKSVFFKVFLSLILVSGVIGVPYSIEAQDQSVEEYISRDPYAPYNTPGTSPNVDPEEIIMSIDGPAPETSNGGTGGSTQGGSQGSGTGGSGSSGSLNNTSGSNPLNNTSGGNVLNNTSGGNIWNNVISGGSRSGGGAGFEFKNPLRADSLAGFINLLLGLLIQLAIPVIALFIIWSGFLFVSARGNEAQLTKAKQTLWYTMLGAAVILGARVISEIITSTLLSL